MERRSSSAKLCPVLRYTPMIWTSMLRGRGPSSSAKRIDWNRPSDSSPPLMPTAPLRPRGRGAVEGAKKRSLEPPEGKPPAADAHGHASAEEGGAQMGMRVAALAVGE